MANFASSETIGERFLRIALGASQNNLCRLSSQYAPSDEQSIVQSYIDGLCKVSEAVANAHFVFAEAPQRRNEPFAVEIGLTSREGIPYGPA